MSAAVTCPNVTIKLSHSNLVNLTSTFANNLSTGQGGQTTVLANGSVSFPAGAAGSWHTIAWSTPFHYNGVDNLIVEFMRAAACTGVVRDDVVTTWPYTAVVYAFSNTDAAGSTGTWAADARLVFAGGDDKIDLGGASSNPWPFADTAFDRPRIQNLYLASEINGSGPITGIAFQLNTISGAGSYTYTLKLGHSTLTALTTTFASNYSGPPTTVANAVTFSIPANIPAGTWVWVPIPDGVFTYNGTDNLIVEVATSSGSANTNLRTKAIAGRRVWADESGGAVTDGAVDDAAYHIALRFNGATVDVLPNGDGTSGQVL